MSLRMNLWPACAAIAALCAAGPASADVREGVDAWSRGDYAAAVSEWQGPAEAGNPDAMFNLGQAYRLGRGVPQNLERALTLYSQAAQAGHVQAADTFGLMLFQGGRREEALPYVEDAARRGDPRAQYLLGIAHFNGDIVGRDWVRAYALLTLANSEGLPQASEAIAEMDRHIPLEQRQQAAGLAEQLRREADAARASELAAAELGQPPSAAAPAPTRSVPQPIATTAVSPSVAAARDAIAEARRATGAEDPADAGASYAGGDDLVSAAAPPPRRAEPPAPAPTVADAAAEPASESQARQMAATGGPWRVQLGAFSVDGNAERLWDRLSSRSELSGARRLLVPSGRVTLLLADGYASRAEAEAACRSLKRSGHDCLVNRD